MGSNLSAALHRGMLACGWVLILTRPAAMAQTNLVIDATQHRSIGGVGSLDRARFFNHWGTHVIGQTNLGNLSEQLIASDGLHSVTGRETFEFDVLVQGLNEDPANPGFFRKSDVVNRLQGQANSFSVQQYRGWVTNGSRWESLREHANPVLVQSGRASGAWPAWIKDGTTLPIRDAGAAYADLLNIYLEEVVYGTGPNQGYLPFDKERFHVEIMNEPQLELSNGVTWGDVIEFHKNVTIAVKERFPQASLGGASVGEAPFPAWNPHRWDLAKQMMDDMTTWRDASGDPVEFDFWTFHPYDVHRVLAGSGVKQTQVRESVGHLEGMMDLFESYSDIRFGDPKRFAVTEYGATIYTQDGSQNFGSYSRTERQWDQVVDVKKKLLAFMDRPDRIINATPFLAPQWFTGSSPTEESGAHYAMWDRQADGSWKETIIAGMYRMYNDVRGEYVGIDSDHPDLQSLAFRDGDRLHVLLNNLSDSVQAVDIQALVGTSTIIDATLDRVLWDGSEGVYHNDLDVTQSWQSLNLSGDEGAKLTLTLDQAIDFERVVDEVTHYGDDVQAPINLAGSRSKTINIEAETRSALSAVLRVGIAERPNVWNESFQVVINGSPITVPATGSIGFDDADSWLFTREVGVPIELLNDGTNDVYVDFASNGGQLVTTSLILTNGPGIAGDFNNDGVVDAADYTVWRDDLGDPSEYALWVNNFGYAAPAVSVPEPSGGALLVGVFAFLTRRLRTS